MLSKSWRDTPSTALVSYARSVRSSGIARVAQPTAATNVSRAWRCDMAARRYSAPMTPGSSREEPHAERDPGSEDHRDAAPDHVVADAACSNLRSVARRC